MHHLEAGGSLYPTIPAAALARLRLRLLALATLVLLAGAAKSKRKAPAKVTVMTRNVYLGAALDPALNR